MSEFVAGALAGAIMGLAAQAYWLLVLSHRPLDAFKREESRVGTVIVFGGLVAVGGWILIGGLLGAFVGAIRPDDTDALLIPSVGFLLVLLFLAVLVMIPALVLMRTWKRHVLITFLLFTGLFGLLLPNLVVAVQS